MAEVIPDTPVPAGYRLRDERLVPAGRHQPGQLRLIQPQPHERIRRGRQRLQRPGALADHCDQLLAGVGVADRGPQQLRGPRPGRDPERDQRPVRRRRDGRLPRRLRVRQGVYQVNFVGAVQRVDGVVDRRLRDGHDSRGCG